MAWGLDTHLAWGDAEFGKAETSEVAPLNDRTKLQAVPRDTGNLVKDSPGLAARRATVSREAAVMDDLTSTRQYMNTLARPAAEYMGSAVNNPEDAHPLGVMAARDILDRTIGKAAQELRIGPADQTLDILKELDSGDA